MRLQQVSSHEEFPINQGFPEPECGLEVYLVGISSLNMCLNLSAGTREPATLGVFFSQNTAGNRSYVCSSDISRQAAWSDLHPPSLHMGKSEHVGGLVGLMISWGCRYEDVNAPCKRLNLLFGCVSFTVTCSRRHSRALDTRSHHEILAKPNLVFQIPNTFSLRQFLTLQGCSLGL